MKRSNIFLLLILQIFILNGCKYNDANKLKDINDKKEILYIYNINADNDGKLYKKINSKIEVDNNLNKEAKVIKLKDNLENTMDNIDIKLYFDENILIVEAIEKTPIYETSTLDRRYEQIKTTFLQEGYKGIWFKDVVVNYKNEIS